MRKNSKIFLTAAAVMMIVTSGTVFAESDSGENLSVVLYANGSFGDNAYFDGNKEGVLRAEEELGIKAKLIEGGSEQADYKPAIEALAASGEYDIIVTLTGKTSDIVLELADKYPEQDFFVMDTTMNEVRPNIFNSMYNQCEGSFLAGAFAALVTSSTELENANPEKVIGFVGIMDSPTINDFYDGYEQGAHYVDSEVEVLKSYIGDSTNAPKAKELAMRCIIRRMQILFLMLAQVQALAHWKQGMKPGNTQ